MGRNKRKQQNNAANKPITISLSIEEWNKYKQYYEKMPVIIETVNEIEENWNSLSNYLIEEFSIPEEDLEFLSDNILQIICLMRDVYNPVINNYSNRKKKKKRIIAEHYGIISKKKSVLQRADIIIEEI